MMTIILEMHRLKILKSLLIVFIRLEVVIIFMMIERYHIILETIFWPKQTFRISGEICNL